jgi:hypothetical protein
MFFYPNAGGALSHGSQRLINRARIDRVIVATNRPIAAISIARG